jgi:hypothetical protein
MVYGTASYIRVFFLKKKKFTLPPLFILKEVPYIGFTSMISDNYNSIKFHLFSLNKSGW